MSTITKMTIRPRGANKEVFWLTGNNVVEAAKWLQDNGRVTASITFHGYGENLSVHGNRREPPKGADGVWMDTDGCLYTKEHIAEHYVVVAESHR